MSALLDLIKTRRSVRTFDGRPLNSGDRQKLEAFLADVPNPFGIPVEFVLLDAGEYGLASPVITGEKLYVTGKVKKGPYADVAFGCSMEKLVLYAWSLGIGTTWIGGTMKRETFEKAACLGEGEMMPCISPLGYPAEKQSLRERMMRKGVGADNRVSVDCFFFDRAWGVPFPLSPVDGTAELAEMVRWAPSAVNKQPWRIIAEDGSFHFYLKHDKGYVSDKVGDMQKVDIGIALCHFTAGIEEQGRTPEVFIRDPEIDIPEDVEYIATVRG